jgi:hypothetical protein
MVHGLKIFRGQSEVFWELQNDDGNLKMIQRQIPDFLHAHSLSISGVKKLTMMWNLSLTGSKDQSRISLSCKVE